MITAPSLNQTNSEANADTNRTLKHKLRKPELTIRKVQTSQPVWSRMIDEAPLPPPPPLDTPDDTGKLDAETEANLNPESPTQEPRECGVHGSYGENYLTPVDILVTAGEDLDLVCIKAKFALSIKWEEARFVTSPVNGNQSPTNSTSLESNPILGYVPLENVISVEQTCPEPVSKDKTKTENESAATNETIGATGDKESESKTSADKTGDKKDEELEMIVTFDCGKFSFTFGKDDSRFYVSAIVGQVKLG